MAALNFGGFVKQNCAHPVAESARCGSGPGRLVAHVVAVLFFVALVHRALGSGARVLAAWVSKVVVRMEGCRDFHLENGGRASPELGRPRSLCVLCFASTLGAMKTVFTAPTDEHRALKDLAVGWCVGCLCAAHALSSAENNGTRRAKVDPSGPA